MNIIHHFTDGAYAKETHIPAGYILCQHKHNYSHFGILAKGAVELKVNDETKTIYAPACINIEADKHHGVKAITDVVWFCVHATDCTDKDEIDEVLIQPGEDADMKAIVESMKG